MAREKRFRRGDILFHEGAACEEIAIITHGSVKVFRLSDDGRQHTLWILGAGDCFCLAPFFHQNRYPVSAQCMTDVRILKLGREGCLALLGAGPGVTTGVVRCLCDRLSGLAALLEVLSTREVRRRLARMLLDLARNRGRETREGILLDSGLTHDELAACVGTAREVISRTLEQFQRDGLVSLGRRRLLIRDLPGLQAVILRRRPAKDAVR
jgi:CRP/FNR family transcriptional regulator